MARGAWWATVQGVTKSWIGLSTHACDIPLYGETAFLSFSFSFLAMWHNLQDLSSPTRD